MKLARKRRGRFGGEGIKTKMGTEESVMLLEMEANQREMSYLLALLGLSDSLAIPAVALMVRALSQRFELQ